MEESYAFVATYSSVRIKGHTFTAVGDELMERGFDMARAVKIDAMTIEVPHTQPRRAKAKVVANLPEPEPVREIAMQPEVAKSIEAYRAIYDGEAVLGIQTRPCGSIHSDGVVCLIPVLFEELKCGCGDFVFDHDGPHESVDDDGVKYRWTEVLLIQDAEFDTYGVRDDDANDDAQRVNA